MPPAIARYADPSELLESGVIQEANRRFFHILGLDLVVAIQASGEPRLRVLDEREQPGGLTFGRHEARWSRIRLARTRRVRTIWDAAVERRQKACGFVRQPPREL
ncbi:MAG: hypothetical protein WD942_02715 [Dehalococcoidia bacterium]